MKKLYMIITTITLTLTVYAQTPDKMSYQAVVRDASDVLVVNQAIGMQISILQGSITGAAVYVELQFPTTNMNGLVSLEIGTGTMVSGDFTTIDWANDSYFIKTETDPTGGVGYTITGTSQLLSVPYALHAKTAENIIGSIPEIDPVFALSIASGITATDTTSWGNHTVDTDTQLDSTGIAALGYVAGTHTVDTDTQLDSAGIAALGYVADAHTDSTAIANMGFVAGNSTYTVGDFALGGIVFYVDGSGEHGLVCAKLDQSTGMRWHAGFNGNTRVYGDGPYSGEMNTSIIMAAHISLGDDGAAYAARICYELQLTEGGKTYGDWYLPSKEELNLMYLNAMTIAITAGANGGTNLSLLNYWSSTEDDLNNAWTQDLFNGLQSAAAKSINTYYVRAIRAF